MNDKQNMPDVIYLQGFDDEEAGYSSVTWCIAKAFPSDTPYAIIPEGVEPDDAADMLARLSPSGNRYKRDYIREFNSLLHGTQQRVSEIKADLAAAEQKYAALVEAVRNHAEAKKKTSYHDLYRGYRGRAVQEYLDAEDRMQALAQQDQPAGEANDE